MCVPKTDDLRGYHPDYAKLVAEDYENASYLTQADCNYWVEKLIKEIAERKGDVIIEGTMRRPEVITGTAELLTNHGFNVSAIALAVPREISLASVMYRYEIQAQLGNLARFVKPESHDAAYYGIKETIKVIEDLPLIRNIEIFSRRGVSYKNETPGIHLENTKASVIFDRLISVKMEINELRYAMQLFNESLEMARKRNADSGYIELLIELSTPIRKKLENLLELKNHRK